MYLHIFDLNQTYRRQTLETDVGKKRITCFMNYIPMSHLSVGCQPGSHPSGHTPLMLLQGTEFRHLPHVFEQFSP